MGGSLLKTFVLGPPFQAFVFLKWGARMKTNFQQIRLKAPTSVAGRPPQSQNQV